MAVGSSLCEHTLDFYELSVTWCTGSDGVFEVGPISLQGLEGNAPFLLYQFVLVKSVNRCKYRFVGGPLMRTKCPLCQRPVSRDSKHWCECGQALDAGCYDAHLRWCAVHGEESWIDAVEL